MFNLIWWASNVKLLKISTIFILLKVPIAVPIND